VSIIINELTLQVTGNVVKKFTTDGAGSLLTMTERQAAEIYNDLAEHFGTGIKVPVPEDDKVFGKTGEPPTPVSVLKPVTGSQEELKNQVDGTQ
jgi:hypothetical protein